MPSTLLGTEEATVNLTDIIPLHRTSLEEGDLKFLNHIRIQNSTKFYKKKKNEAKIEDNITTKDLLYIE